MYEESRIQPRNQEQLQNISELLILHVSKILESLDACRVVSMGRDPCMACTYPIDFLLYYFSLCVGLIYIYIVIGVIMGFCISSLVFLCEHEAEDKEKYRRC